MAELLFMEPVFKERIWGGRELEKDFGFMLPAGAIGECWAISALPEGESIVKNGQYAEWKLSELWKEHPQVFGREVSEEKFPLLVKILDAQSDLSVQVHPDDGYAARHENGSLGKRECWYILNCKPEATIIVGQNAKDKDSLQGMIEGSDWKNLLHEIPIHKGDFFQIEPGCVHAIKAGTELLETQQSSDVTYRLYDYDRVDSSGNKRELHLEKSMDVIDFSLPVPQDGINASQESLQGLFCLEKNTNYTVYVAKTQNSTETISNKTGFLCTTIVDGEGVANGYGVKKGDSFICPAAFDVLELTGNLEVVVSHT